MLPIYSQQLNSFRSEAKQKSLSISGEAFFILCQCELAARTTDYA
jgi:hypothetical protein